MPATHEPSDRNLSPSIQLDAFTAPWIEATWHLSCHDGTESAAPGTEIVLSLIPIKSSDFRLMTQITKRRSSGARRDVTPPSRWCLGWGRRLGSCESVLLEFCRAERVGGTDLVGSGWGVRRACRRCDTGPRIETPLASVPCVGRDLPAGRRSDGRDGRRSRRAHPTSGFPRVVVGPPGERRSLAALHLYVRAERAGFRRRDRGTRMARSARRMARRSSGDRPRFPTWRLGVELARASGCTGGRRARVRRGVARRVTSRLGCIGRLLRVCGRVRHLVPRRPSPSRLDRSCRK
jgi:hypothetical protein